MHHCDYRETFYLNVYHSCVWYMCVFICLVQSDLFYRLLTDPPPKSVFTQKLALMLKLPLIMLLAHACWYASHCFHFHLLVLPYQMLCLDRMLLTETMMWKFCGSASLLGQMHHWSASCCHSESDLMPPCSRWLRDKKTPWEPPPLPATPRYSWYRKWLLPAVWGQQ